ARIRAAPPKGRAYPRGNPARGGRGTAVYGLRWSQKTWIRERRNVHGCGALVMVGCVAQRTGRAMQKERILFWLAAVIAVGFTLAFLYQISRASDGGAAWVQAVASVAAIWWSGKSARDLQQTNLRQQRITRTRAVLRISEALSSTVQAATNRLIDRETLERVYRAEIEFDQSALEDFERAVQCIPLHDLETPELVTQVLMLRSTIRQFRENAEHALKDVFSMDSDSLDLYFKSNREMSACCDDITSRIRSELAKIESAVAPKLFNLG
ncbi:hypothetical protein, partial [Burkholderia pseudomallei]|uniref:hypothetical protein n=7 Tax=Burkholderia pseudomallei TaxID=28450 RepID=UPI001C4C21D5